MRFSTVSEIPTPVSRKDIHSLEFTFNSGRERRIGDCDPAFCCGGQVHVASSGLPFAQIGLGGTRSWYMKVTCTCCGRVESVRCEVHFTPSVHGHLAAPERSRA